MQGRKWSINIVLGLTLTFASGLAVASGSQNKEQGSTAGLSNLPVAAQGTISAKLGRDLPAYRVRAASVGFQAENAKKTLKADFTPAGVTFHAAGAVWGMSLRGIGYGEHLSPVAAAKPQASANRVEYRRGSLTEWYVNGPVGLEQGFTLNEPPGRANGEPLTVELGFSGNLTATVDAAKTGLTLSGVHNGKLRYTGFSARDAGGKDLRASLEIRGGRLLLKADDASAQYPVVIDPWVQLAKLTVFDGASDDFFGGSVAASGNTLVVGAPQYNAGGPGAAYIFVKPSSGWQDMTQTAELTASDGAANDSFGASVAISGNTVVIGAQQAGGYQGAAYVFVEPTGGWVNMTETAKLTASDGIGGDQFGSAVATNGSTVIVGAFAWNQAQGKAYVFVEPPDGWQTTSAFKAILTASHGESSDALGASAAISGTAVAIGSPGGSGQITSRGTVRIFVKPASGWVDMTETAKLSASDGKLGDLLGTSVAISGNTAVAGAPNHVGRLGGGAAYVFVEPANGWKTGTQTAELTPSDGAGGATFGVSVSIAGRGVVAGAAQEFTGPGAAYVFTEPANGWKNMTQTAKLTAADGNTGDWFGWFVAISGNTVVVGARDASISGNSNQGAAYVFGP